MNKKNIAEATCRKSRQVRADGTQQGARQKGWDSVVANFATTALGVLADTSKSGGKY